MSKNKLTRVGVLAPAALSACMDASVLAVPAAGAIVSTVLKELSKAFMLKRWFHGNISAKDAEYLMMDKGKNGSYLVRESRGHPGDYVLTVKVRGRVSHVIIKKQNDKYEVSSGEQFDDLVELIEYFRSYPIVETSGDVLRLHQPVSGTCLRPVDLQKRVVNMQEVERESKTDHKYGFFDEFHFLQKSFAPLGLTTNVAERPENNDKNRYKNVLPYDQTRVILNAWDKKCSDYINASHIKPYNECDLINSVICVNDGLNKVHSLTLRNDSKIPILPISSSVENLPDVTRCQGYTVKEKRYIATQGCLSNTVNDFWRMIWQEDVRVIVMITKEFDKGKLKCERYWPDVGHSLCYSHVTVFLMKETFAEDYICRELEVKSNGTMRRLHHYQYIAWPDHSAPKDPKGVLSLLGDVNETMGRIARSESKPEKNILCVHCSAGVGRTGTLIVLDMLVDKINQAGFNCVIDIFNTVKHVRSQRKGMVQNKSQYKFIYEALQEYIDRNSCKISKKVYSSEL